MIWVLGRWRRPRYGVRGAREPSFEQARASRVRQSSFACRVSLRRLWRRPTGWVTAVDQVRPGSRPGHSVGSCKVSVGSYLAHRGELLSSPWGVVAHARSTSESFAAPAGPARCPAPWTWTVSESLVPRLLMLAVHAADTDADPSPGFPGRSPPPPPPWHSSVPVARPATPPRRRRRLQLGGLPPQCPHPTPHPSDFTAAAAAAASGRVWPRRRSGRPREWQGQGSLGWRERAALAARTLADRVSGWRARTSGAWCQAGGEARSARGGVLN
jgi:hypothetical protein